MRNLTLEQSITVSNWLRNQESKKTLSDLCSLVKVDLGLEMSKNQMSRICKASGYKTSRKSANSSPRGKASEVCSLAILELIEMLGCQSSYEKQLKAIALHMKIPDIECEAANQSKE